MEYPESERDPGPEGSATPGAALWPLLRAVRANAGVVATIVAVTVCASIAWLVQRSDSYATSAEVLVTPLSASDRSFVGLPLIRAVGPDASAGIGSAVSIIDTREAATLLAERLDDGTTPEAIDTAVNIERDEEESSVITVSARAPDPLRAAALADGFTKAALDLRAERLERLADRQIKRSKELLNDARDGGSSFIATEALRTRIADLRQIGESGDPTLSFARRAVLPEAPEGAPPALVLFASVIAGIGLGCATAVLIELLGPARISGEDSLLDAYPLPVLARLPRFSPASGSVSPVQLAAIREAHRGLRAQIEFQVPEPGLPSGRPRGRALAIAGVSRGDKVPLVASNLGYAVERSGTSCSIIDPAGSGNGSSSTLVGGGSEREAVQVPGGQDVFTRMPFGAGRLELVAPAGGALEAELSHEAIEALVDSARSWSDWVIVEAPAAATSAAALSSFGAVDAVLLVVELRRTSVRELQEVRQNLELAKVRPIGYVLVGRERRGALGLVRSRLERFFARARTSP